MGGNSVDVFGGFVGIVFVSWKGQVIFGYWIVIGIVIIDDGGCVFCQGLY